MRCNSTQSEANALPRNIHFGLQTWCFMLTWVDRWWFSFLSPTGEKMKAASSECKRNFESKLPVSDRSKRECCMTFMKESDQREEVKREVKDGGVIYVYVICVCVRVCVCVCVCDCLISLGRQWRTFPCVFELLMMCRYLCVSSTHLYLRACVCVWECVCTCSCACVSAPLSNYQMAVLPNHGCVT